MLKIFDGIRARFENDELSKKERVSYWIAGIAILAAVTSGSITYYLWTNWGLVTGEAGVAKTAIENQKNEMLELKTDIDSKVEDIRRESAQIKTDMIDIRIGISQAMEKVVAVNAELTEARREWDALRRETEGLQGELAEVSRKVEENSETLNEQLAQARRKLAESATTAVSQLEAARDEVEENIRITGDDTAERLERRLEDRALTLLGDFGRQAQARLTELEEGHDALARLLETALADLEKQRAEQVLQFRERAGDLAQTQLASLNQLVSTVVNNAESSVRATNRDLEAIKGEVGRWLGVQEEQIEARQERVEQATLRLDEALDEAQIAVTDLVAQALREKGLDDRLERLEHQLNQYAGRLGSMLEVVIALMGTESDPHSLGQHVVFLVPVTSTMTAARDIQAGNRVCGSQALKERVLALLSNVNGQKLPSYITYMNVEMAVTHLQSRSCDVAAVTRDELRNNPRTFAEVVATGIVRPLSYGVEQTLAPGGTSNAG